MKQRCAISLHFAPAQSIFGIASFAAIVENRHFVWQAWQGTRVAKKCLCLDRSLPRRLSTNGPHHEPIWHVPSATRT